MKYSIQMLPSATKELEALPASIRGRVDRAIAALADNPFLRPPKVKALKGQDEGFLRLRVGDYRVVYQVRKKEIVILIVRIRHRREAYRRS